MIATGDYSTIGLYLVLGIIALGIIIGYIVVTKKKK